MNNRISKWFLTLLLAAVFAFCLPLGVLAAEAATQPDKDDINASQDENITTQDNGLNLTVGGVALYKDGAATGNTVDGAIYDASTYTLTLNNYSYTAERSSTYDTGNLEGIAASGWGDATFTVKLIGTNTINIKETGSVIGADAISLGSKFAQNEAPIKIEGPGTLNITAISNNTVIGGIGISSSNFMISDATININCTGNKGWMSNIETESSAAKMAINNSTLNLSITGTGNEVYQECGIKTGYGNISIANSTIKSTVSSTTGSYKVYPSCIYAGYNENDGTIDGGDLSISNSNLILQSYHDAYSINTAKKPTFSGTAYFYGGSDGPTTQLSADTFVSADGTGRYCTNHKYSQIATHKIGAKDISAISMAAAPTKTTYTVADKLDVSGGKLNVTYDDGSTDSVALTDTMCSGYDPTRIGTQTVTVTYEGKTTSFNVTVNAKSDGPSVLYQTHIQNIGWNQGWKIDGDETGTHGQSLRLEAIQVKLSNAKVSGSVQYKTHIQNKGWETNWSNDGAVSGTSGQGLRLEAIQIQLTGEMANQYDIYYRVHAQNFGWLGWAKNGESAGTAGYAYRLEAIQIQLVKKGSAAPGSTDNAFKQPLVSYQTHVQNVGWQNYVNDGAVSGTEGQSLRLEGIKVNLASQPYTGSIQYKTHIQNLGWETSWHANGDMSGTQGQSLRLEAIQIQLTGEMAGHYDVYYRVHAQNFGDLGWAKNGESAGTAGYGYRLEAIQIQLVTKGGAAPGSTDQAFVQR